MGSCGGLPYSFYELVFIIKVILVLHSCFGLYVLLPLTPDHTGLTKVVAALRYFEPFTTNKYYSI